MLTVVDVLNDGGIIYHAPVSGGIILVNSNGEKSAVQPTISDFLKLCKTNQIEIVDSMRRGHHIFHGWVNVYKKKEE